MKALHIIVCIDDKNGISFNGRRQSRDRVLDKYLADRYGIDAVFVEKALPSAEDINKITLCRWNRVYPADTYFDIPLESYTLLFSEDIQGSSHERITVEEYEKNV